MNSEKLKSFIRETPDFPKPRILFRDISPLLLDAGAFSSALDILARQMPINEIDCVIGIEARGFVLGAAFAARFRKGFVLMRKSGKLPPPVFSQSYQLEYGQATLEIQRGSGRALVVDDVLATGGTLKTAIHLAGLAGYNVRAAGVLIDLRELNKFRFDGGPVHSVMQYE